MKRSTPILLSVLICTLPERATMLARLKPLFRHPEVEIITDPATHLSIGAKRNRLLALAKGKYLLFADDDDLINREAYLLIIEALRLDPDTVGIQGKIYEAGREKQWYISIKYESWFEKDNVYYRFANHLSPVRSKLAKTIVFPDKNFSEDHAYSVAIRPLLKTEVIVPVDYYYYQPSGRPLKL